MMSTIKGMRGKTMAVLVAACMLLCVLSPAIVNWNEEGSFATDGDEPKKFVYVSLGDSTTNGYGMEGYLPSADIIAQWGCRNPWIPSTDSSSISFIGY